MCPPPSDPPSVRPSSWVLLSVPSASAAGWCLLLWRQPIRGLTSSVSKIWLTGQPQRLRLLSEEKEEGEDGGGCLPSLSGCSFPSPWRWLGIASCFRPLKLWCGILSVWEPLCWFTARSAGTKDQTVTDINYLGQRRLREARSLLAFAVKKIALVPAVSTSNTTRKAGVCYRGPCVAFPGCTPTQILTETGGRGPHLQLNSSYLFQCSLKYHGTMFISVKFMSLMWL